MADLNFHYKKRIRKIIIFREVTKNAMKKENNKKQLTDEEIEKKLKRYSSRDLQHTRKYLIENLKNDSNFKAPKGIMLKEDFIEQYYLSRKKSGNPIFNYDFSLLPDYIQHRKEKVNIIVNEKSPKSGKDLGIWKVSYKDLVVNGADQGSLGGIKSRPKTAQYVDTEIFIKRSKEKFGEGVYGYDRVIYVDNKTSVELFCCNCGKYFWQKPTEHLYGAGYGCPKCAMKLSAMERALTTEEFCNRLDNIFGIGYFDYSETIYINSRIRVTVVDPITGEKFIRNPYVLLEGNDPHMRGKSKGEFFIERWLNNHSEIKFVPGLHFNEIIGREKGNKHVGVYADFIVYKDDKNIWIEYNGKQHYMFMKNSYFHKNGYSDFIAQVNRDNNVKEYCKENNFIYLEIPYTYDTEESIDEILSKVILQDINPSEIISIPLITIKKGGESE